MSFIQAGRCQIPYKAVIDAPFYLDTPAPEPKVTSASTMRISTSHTSLSEVRPLRLPLKPQEQQAVAQILKHIYADLESLDSTIKQQFQTCENYGLETVSALWPTPEKHAQIEALLHQQATTTCQNLLKKGLITADIQKKCEPAIAASIQLFTAHHLQIMKAEYDVSISTQLIKELFTQLFHNAGKKIDDFKSLGDFPRLFLAKTLQASPVGLMMYAAYCKGGAYLSLKQQCEKIALSSYSNNELQSQNTADQRRAAQLFLKVLESGQSSKKLFPFKWFNEQHQVIGLSPPSAKGLLTIPALGGVTSLHSNNLTPMLYGIQNLLKSSIEAKACSIRSNTAQALVKQLASSTPDFNNLLKSHQQAFLQEQSFLDRFLHIPQHIQTFLEEAYAQQFKSVEQQYKKEEMPGVKLVEGASFQNDQYIDMQQQLFAPNPLERIRLLGLEMAPSILRPYFDRYDCIKHIEGLNYQRADGSSFMTFAQAQNSGFITTHCHPQALEQLGFAQNYDEFNNSDLDHALMHHNNEVLSKPVYLPGLAPPEAPERETEPQPLSSRTENQTTPKSILSKLLPMKESKTVQAPLEQQDLIAIGYDKTAPVNEDNSKAELSPQTQRLESFENTLQPEQTPKLEQIQPLLKSGSYSSKSGNIIKSDSSTSYLGALKISKPQWLKGILNRVQAITQYVKQAIDSFVQLLKQYQSTHEHASDNQKSPSETTALLTADSLDQTKKDHAPQPNAEPQIETQERAQDSIQQTAVYSQQPQEIQPSQEKVIEPKEQDQKQDDFIQTPIDQPLPIDTKKNHKPEPTPEQKKTIIRKPLLKQEEEKPIQQVRIARNLAPLFDTEGMLLRKELFEMRSAIAWSNAWI